MVIFEKEGDFSKHVQSDTMHQWGLALLATMRDMNLDKLRFLWSDCVSDSLAGISRPNASTEPGSL